MTNYYASYFSIHSLLCMQGRTITRLQLDAALQAQIVPLDIRKNIFGITGRHLGKNPHHETPWQRFYDIYDRYAVSHASYELVARKAYTTDPADESIERNALNYVSAGVQIESPASVVPELPGGFFWRRIVYVPSGRRISIATGERLPRRAAQIRS